MIKSPLISIIIVNHNGKKWLKNCLTPLTRQSYKKIEIIFVDNNSFDDSLKAVKKISNKIIIVKSEENLGFAGGNNLGFEKAKGEYIILLNNDTKVGRDYVKNFVKAFDEIPNLAIAQSKIVYMNDNKKIDTCGSYLTSTSFLYHYGNGKNSSFKKYNKSFPVFSVKAASVIIKSDVVKKLGFFDLDFWSYYEETDLCHRIWNAGYECWYWPHALCQHAVGGTSLAHFDFSYVQFHNFKNKLLSFLKNFESTSLIYFIPVFLLLNILLSYAWLLQGKVKYFLAIYKGIYWNIKNIAKTLIKRKKIQTDRKKSDSELFKKLLINPNINYYKYLFNDDIKSYKDNL